MARQAAVKPNVELALTFEILPAIDLRGGQVVRLRQGDFDRETAYGQDPAEVAVVFANAGARWLHVVDLDGARAGEPVNGTSIAAIASAVTGRASAEVAGGIRSATSVDQAFAAGAARIVVGTAALRDPAFAAGLVERIGSERVAVALDVRDRLAVGDGWRTGADGLPADDALRTLSDAGIDRFEVTAINRDGILDGPDLDLLESLVRLDRGDIIASGGISSLADLRSAADLGCVGAIVGRAIYEGRIDLAEAMQLAATFG
jgi:phosphoribosylformimino-5-aminoimidazole carboxamide ribotide isomerase